MTFKYNKCQPNPFNFILDVADHVEKQFRIVLFDDGLQLVPKNWISRDFVGVGRPTLKTPNNIINQFKLWKKLAPNIRDVRSCGSLEAVVSGLNQCSVNSVPNSGL